MPITQFFGGSYFDPETTRVMGVAFEMAREALQLGDQGNLINEKSPKELSSLQKPVNSIPIFCVSVC